VLDKMGFQCKIPFMLQLSASNIYVIPDVHGDPDALHQSLRALGATDNNGDLLDSKAHFLFLGDYVDRGKRGVEVLDYITDFRKKILEAGGNVICLMGNHDMKLLEIAFGRVDRGFAAHSLLNEVGGADLNEQRARLRAKIGKDWPWLLEAPLCAQIGSNSFVHGGLNPDWAQEVKIKGMDAMNTEFQDALNQATSTGDWTAFDRFNVGGFRNNFPQDKSPVWFNFREYAQIGSKCRTEVADALLALGVNKLVVGHDQNNSGPLRGDLLASSGQRLSVFNADTAMSIGHGHPSLAQSGFGGLVIRPDGKVEGLKQDGILVELFPNCASGHDKTVQEDDED
jgi:hypothetical protein